MSISFERFACGRSSRLLRAPSLALAFAVSGLFGCVAEMPSPPGNDRFLVEPIRLTHRVIFASGDSELGDAELYELATFLDESDPDGRAAVYLDARGPDKANRVGAVAAALGSLGRQSGGSGGVEGSEQGVTVTRLQDVVLPESCLSGDGWPQPHLPQASCTQALTLVRMVEDQRDLFHGRPIGPASSESAARAAMRHYERGAGAPVEERSAGSDVETDPELPPAPLTRDASY